jgi:hypothetical protein
MNRCVHIGLAEIKLPLLSTGFLHSTIIWLKKRVFHNSLRNPSAEFVWERWMLFRDEKSQTLLGSFWPRRCIMGEGDSRHEWSPAGHPSVQNRQSISKNFREKTAHIVYFYRFEEPILFDIIRRLFKEIEGRKRLKDLEYRSQQLKAGKYKKQPELRTTNYVSKSLEWFPRLYRTKGGFPRAHHSKYRARTRYGFRAIENTKSLIDTGLPKRT